MTVIYAAASTSAQETYKLKLIRVSVTRCSGFAPLAKQNLRHLIGTGKVTETQTMRYFQLNYIYLTVDKKESRSKLRKVWFACIPVGLFHVFFCAASSDYM